MENTKIYGIIGFGIVVILLLAMVFIGPSLEKPVSAGVSKFKVVNATLYNLNGDSVIKATIQASGIPSKVHDNLYEVIVNKTTYYAFYKQSSDGQVVWYYNGTDSYTIYLSTLNSTYSPAHLSNGIYKAEFVSQQGSSTITISFGIAPKPSLNIISAQLFNVSGYYEIYAKVNANIPLGRIYFYSIFLNDSEYYIFYHPSGSKFEPTYYIDKSGTYNISLYVFPRNYTSEVQINPNNFTLLPGEYNAIIVTSIGNYSMKLTLTTVKAKPEFQVENTAVEGEYNSTIGYINVTITATTPLGGHISLNEINLNGTNYTVYYEPEILPSAIAVYVYSGTSQYTLYIDKLVTPGIYEVTFFYSYKGVNYSFEEIIKISS
ncbi:hypothetical protein [Acidianus manzaensis]|uniref:Uncharacterized protein n=1 Tax=Acidianus manzaensis TaxID=282676 RepID=A0A1W6K2L5_9CREN|nr:hypothetical protein [Acidianus manzaensis]ARM76702.1 hypothetical protein B6F84_12230 [Acidianus manzaensis]